MTEFWNRVAPPAPALDLIAKVEAFRGTAYQDGTGVWTVGFGSTVMPNGRRVVHGDVLSPADARLLLGRQAAAWCAAVVRHVASPLGTGEAAALVSWVHNLGEGSLRGSTLASMLNAGRHDLAQRQFGGWVMAGGQKSLGLMRRRELERRIFAGGALSEYENVWCLGEAAFEPAYASAVADAAAWHAGMGACPAAAPAPAADALNKMELTRVQAG